MKKNEGKSRNVKPINTWWLWEDRNENDKENAVQDTVRELGTDLNMSQMELTHY